MLVSKEFYSAYVQLPPNEVPPEIRDNPKFFPYFSECRGALDGTLLHAFVSKFDMARYRCRKGYTFAISLQDEKGVLLIQGYLMKHAALTLL